MLIALFQWFVKLTGFLPERILLGTRCRFENREIQGRRIRGGAVILSNHLSVYDYAVLLFVFPLSVIRCIAAEVLYKKNFLLSLFLNAMGCIRADRYGMDFSFLGKAERILEKNGVVLCFPESRLPLKTEKELLPFKPSAAYIALHSGKPVIPVYTDGRYFKKRPCTVMIGTPVTVSEWADDTLSEKENLEKISERLREKILALKEELEKTIGT